MRTINSLDEILHLAEQGNLYVRWSRGPAKDMKQGCSRDYVSGGCHQGLSCQRISPDNDRSLTAMMLVEYQFLRSKDSKIYGWLFYAEENGRDSDNAPTVDAESIVPAGKLSDTLIKKLSSYSSDYWRYQQTKPRSFGEREAWYNASPKLADYI